MSFDGLQFRMSGFTPVLHNLSPLEDLNLNISMTPNSVKSFEVRMGKKKFEREGLFNGERRLEEAIRKLKLDGIAGDHDVMTALAHFERVFPDDGAILTKINDVVAEDVRKVYKRSGKIDAYINALRRKVAESTILPFDELPYDGSLSCNWMSRNPRLSTLEPHMPVYMTTTMVDEMLFKDLDPIELDVLDIDISSIKKELLTFDSCQIIIRKFCESLSFGLSMIDSVNSEELYFELEDNPATQSLITMFIKLSREEDLYKRGVLSKIVETNSRMFYVCHMMTFQEMIAYSQKHENPFLLVRCTNSQFNYVCGSMITVSEVFNSGI